MLRAGTGRLVGVDATRGIALFGMMGLHALDSSDAAGNPTLSNAVVTGRSAAVFAVLAGLGIAFTTRRRKVPGGREGWAVAAALTGRAFGIGLIGLSLGYADIDVVDVILAYYGAMFLLAIPLVFLSTRGLVAAVVALPLAVPVLSQLIRDLLPEPALENPSFGYLFTDPLGLLVEVMLTGGYPALPWMTYLAVGILLGRLRLSSMRTAWAMFGAGTAMAVGAALLSRLLLGPFGGMAAILSSAADDDLTPSDVDDIMKFGESGTTPTGTWWWLVADVRHTGTPIDLIHTTGVAVALLGAVLLLTHVTRPVPSKVVHAVFVPLSAVGAMPLTIYSAHIAFMVSPLDVFDAVPGYLVQLGVALAFAVVWRSFFERGPLEWAVSLLSNRARDAVLGRGG
ncbi:heparan-alpha-glucosaminide N-acetyltransferase domain-containing protein [Saccharopolyspora taberi]|uniref:Heparan-alpha-glucosaminide N-acetyltransferase domain-containing protein n=1 Tax=Saccharopolyspora taberi TaxID=60895 RepID=A0ABN3V995_9PSEU